MNPLYHVYRKIFFFTVLILLVVALGMFGYHLIEGWPLFDGLYMTVITLATIGYGETHPLSHAGRVFTMVLILFGSGVLLYAVSSLTAYIVEGELTHAIRRSKMQNAIAKLKGHYIICGHGSTGKYAVEELHKTGRKIVVIEKDLERVAHLNERNILTVEGDATADEILQAAGIKHAHGLIASLHSDAENLFLVLTAKSLNPKLRVIAKAVEEASQKKLRTVGADGVVLPNHIGGLRLVSEMVRPSVVTFLDVMLREKNQAIRVEEIRMPYESPFAGSAVEDLGIQRIEGVTLVALQKGEDQYMFNPHPATAVRAGDVLIFMGESTRIADIAQRINPQEV